MTLAYRLVPPADYHARMVITQHNGSGPARPLYDFKARIPGSPTPFSTHPRGTVVLLHGYGLDQDTMLPWALFLAQSGWNCVLVDLRGHGESSGERIYFGIREASDLTALISELMRREQVAAPINVVGVSYGAAVALRWATVDPRVNGVVVITPYSRLNDAIEGLRSNFANWLPAGLIQRAARKIPGLVGVSFDGLDPQEWLQDNKIDALFVAAGDDPVAPIKSVEALAIRAGAHPVITLPGISHEQAPFQIEVLREPVTEWLRSVSAGTAGKVAN